ncbi:CBS domain-containing protein [Halobacteriovorax marinus]|uniref:CBS domain-containing protein n=1 Tax=Halobacteriovorax marinus TaxID=97084 RepID=UPI003A91B250
MKVSEFMTKDVISCTEENTVEEAAKIMHDKGFSVMPVVDGAGALIGILTESDFVGTDANIPHALASIKKLFGQNFYFSDAEEIYKKSKVKKLGEVMTKDVTTVTSDQSLSDVISVMSHNHLKRLPVVDGGKLVGIITRKDLLKAYNKLS